MKKTKRIHIIIKGRVHAVGFRQYVYEMAHELHLAGWVRNTEKGTVEVLAEGATENLTLLQRACEKGPVLAHVSEVTAELQEGEQEYREFSIRYD